MKNISLRLMALLVAPLALFSFALLPEKANFSGDWKLNEGKSEFGNFGGRFAARALKVEQKDDAITIASTRPSFQGGDPVTTSQSFGFDGKEVEGTAFGNAKRRSTLKWSEDGQTITFNHITTMEREGQKNEFTATETWSLKDGSLQIVTVSSSPRGEMTTKAVYDK